MTVAKNPDIPGQTHFRYRPDIDGLRAIAVVAVVLFHLWRLTFAGGYLGVDVFFVLSGYLITAIIWQELHAGDFSIRRFYERRLRRIVPALLAVLFVTSGLAAWLLLPADLVGYAKSVLSTLVFVSNIFFWRDGDYFSAAAETKPLLHLWSLGVEEQFYLFFPLILWGLTRRWRRFVFPVVALFALASLVANVLALMFGGASPAFFLLPTRAWELGAGALIALAPAPAVLAQATSARRIAWLNVTAIVGALLLLVPLLVPIATGAVPAAVPVVAGTVMIIVAGTRKASLVNELLSRRSIVFVGAISYSLYLWHWPIIVLNQYYFIGELSTAEKIAEIGLMLLCAIGSWRFIERPFRTAARPPVSARAVVSGACAGAMLLACAAGFVIAGNGLPNRLAPETVRLSASAGTSYRCPLSTFRTFGSSRMCLLDLPSGNPEDADVILLGNSHMQMYAPLLAQIMKEHAWTGILVPLNGCLPTVDINISSECFGMAKGNLDEILAFKKKASTVVIGLKWAHLPGELIDSNGTPVETRDNKALVDGLDRLVDSLEKSGKRVVLIGPIAEPGWEVGSVLSRQMAFGWKADRPAYTDATEFDVRFHDAIAHFESRHDMLIVRPDRIQCVAQRCEYVIDGRSLFSDSNHIAASELYRFKSIFESALNRQAPAE